MTHQEGRGKVVEVGCMQGEKKKRRREEKKKKGKEQERKKKKKKGKEQERRDYTFERQFSENPCINWAA